MSTLADLTDIFRSKNAGPFLITIDMTFSEVKNYDRVKDSGILTAKTVAERYGIDPESVQIFYFDRLATIKVTLPRWNRSSGAPGDRDVYGAQQHGPLLDLEVP